MDPGVTPSAAVAEVLKHPSGWLELRMNRMKKFNRYTAAVRGRA